MITIKNNLINNAIVEETLFLKDLCSIKTGKLDANQMVKNGKYQFFTCSNDIYRIDTYAFDGPSLLISGNGDVGLVRYYNGKFNAYQRTYVLQNFNIDPQYIEIILNRNLPRIISKEKNVGAMPYITMKTLENIPVQIYKNEVISSLLFISKTFENHIEIESELLNNYLKAKKHLLSSLFE